MSYDLDKLRRIAAVLENDGDFHAEYKWKITAKDRRVCIQDYSSKLRRAGDIANSDGMTCDEREQLRRYLDKQWEMPETVGPNPYASEKTVDLYTAVEPEPVKPAAFDYSTLPDGAILIFSDGKTRLKGRRPGVEDGVYALHTRDGRPLFAYDPNVHGDWVTRRVDGTHERYVGADNYHPVIGYRLTDPQPQPDHQVEITQRKPS